MEFLSSFETNPNGIKSKSAKSEEVKIGTFIQFEDIHLNLCKVSRDSYVLLLGLVPNSISILFFFFYLFIF